MKIFKKKYLILGLVLGTLGLASCKSSTPPVNEKPVFAGVGQASIKVYEEFDPLAGVTASDKEDGVLTSSIVVKSNNVDNTVIGTYFVEYEVVDSASNKTSAVRTVKVVALDEEDYPLAQHLSGVNLSLLPGEEKAKLFAAAENYLIDNVYGGVPLYTRATRVMYSDRVQLFSPEYNGVLGFGTAFSQFSQDDSHVLMYGDTHGNAGEFTWRGSFNSDPTGLNPWMADDSNTADFTDMFHGGLFDFFFDETKTGYEILPSLAKSEPIPVNPKTISGRQYAKVWRIEIRDDLQWKYHPSTNISAFPSGHATLNVDDYLWTWRYALEHSWFRARTGGGDFVSQGIKNAAEFLDKKVNWEDVGIRKAAGTTNTLELEYTNEKSTFEIKYGFAGSVLSPINQQLFEALGANYGLDPTKVASSGIYYLDTWTPGQLLSFKKNTLHPDSSEYKYTGYQFRYVNGSDNIFAEFIAGRLESAAVPSSQVNAYINDPRVKVAPDATTWRMVVNGFGTEAKRDAYADAHPEIGIDKTYAPEPILSYTAMRQAFYYGFDRQYAAVDLVKTYLPAHTMFAPTYFIDAESGLSVRGTPEGQAVSDDHAGETHGFVPDAATDLFQAAVAEAISDGHYVAGISTNYTVITLDLYWSSSGNTSAQIMVANLIEQYESRLVDDVHFVRLDIVEHDVEFPTNYYDHMMIANGDLGIGGISGSLLDAPSFLDVFCDDNRGGFTLDWGIDTHTPNIPVSYRNLEGKVVYETWSYNALVGALNAKKYIRDGVEQKAWTNATDLINAYVDMDGKVVSSISDGEDLAGYVLGESLEDIMEAEGFDGLTAHLVVTEDEKSFLYVVSQKGSAFELYSKSALFDNAFDAINSDVGSVVTLTLATKLDDAGVAADPYINGVLGFSTVEEIADDLGIPLEYTEVYHIEYLYKGSPSADGYVVLHIGDVFIPVVWL